MFLKLSALLALAIAAAGPSAPSSRPTTARPPADNLEYWLTQAKPAGTQPSQPAAANPFKATEGFLRDDAIPGVIELSNGKLLPGGLFTTREKPWIVYDDPTKGWRRIPFINVLSIVAVVEEERVELEWRWVGMGEPEKVFTGRKYPMRRMHWRFKLLDGSIVEGALKGQPVSVECQGKAVGPFVLHERMKGDLDTTLADLVYIRRIIVSRRMMEAVTADLDKQLRQAPSPAGTPKGGQTPKAN